MGYKLRKVPKNEKEYIEKTVAALKEINADPNLHIFPTETGFAIQIGDTDIIPHFDMFLQPEEKTESNHKIDFDDEEADGFFDGWGGAS